MPKNIFLNHTSLVPPLSGVGRYSFEISNALHQSADYELHFFVGDHVLSCISPTAFQEADPDQVVRLAQHTPESSVRSGRIPYDKIKDFCGIDLLPVRHWLGSFDVVSKFLNSTRKSKKGNGDGIYHETNFCLLPFDGKTISTIHDLSWLHYPQYHPVERIAYFNENMPRTIEVGDHFVTVSDFVKSEMIQKLSIPAEKISVTPLGVGREYHPRGLEEVLDVLESFELDYKGYILLVGSIEPRKNLATAIHAYRLLDSAIQRQVKLIHVGPSGWLNSDLGQVINSLEIRGQFRSLGYVDEIQLPLIYSAAALLLYPSVYEGFGLPPLEAMASGVPVVASNCASIPEVMDTAGILVEPEDVLGFSNAIAEIIDNKTLHYSLASRGLERASLFTWPETVRKTKKIYNDVIKGTY